MKLSTRVKPISYLKRHAAEIVKNIPERREPMLITRNGEAELVVMDVKSSEEHEETLALLKSLALGNREIEQGHFRPVEEETRSHRFVPFRLRAGCPDELAHIVCDTRGNLKSLLMRRLMQAYRAPLSACIRFFAISTVSALS